MELPRSFRIRQSFAGPRVESIDSEVEQQLQRLNLATRVQPGQTVAVTAGSRGIANIAEILRAIVQHLQGLGLQPFIVPAMGSHGGGTAEGQAELLAGYNITEAFCGCPVRSSMETVVVTEAEEGFPVHFDRCAWEADHVVVANRIKLHTGFSGEIESGLMKMMLIGLGKHNGARIYHRAIEDFSFGQIVRSVAKEVLQKCHILCGVGIVENGNEETALIEAIPADQFELREAALLKISRDLMPSLPFDRADLLLIDEIGKNISGTGMDTNIVGRKGSDHRAPEGQFPKIRYIGVRGLTEKTHGNATGIGIAELCLSRVVEAMNVQITRINCLTGSHMTGAMIPLDYPSDRELIETALNANGLTEPADARVMWIPNTLHLGQVECSEAYYAEACEREDLEILCEPRPLPLDAEGMLPELAEAALSST